MNINISLLEKSKTKKAKKTNTYKLSPSPLSKAQPNKCPPNKHSPELESLIKVCTTESCGKRNTIVDYCFPLRKWGLGSSTLLHNFVANLNPFSCSDQPVPH